MCDCKFHRFTKSIVGWFKKNLSEATVTTPMVVQPAPDYVVADSTKAAPKPRTKKQPTAQPSTKAKSTRPTSTTNKQTQPKSVAKAASTKNK